MPDFSISAAELDALTAKLDRFSGGLTDNERGALLHVFDLAAGDDGDVEGFGMGMLGGDSLFGPPIRTLFTVEVYGEKKGTKAKYERRPEDKKEESPK